MGFGNLYKLGRASTDPGSPNDPKKIYGTGTLWGSGNGNVRAGDTFERAGIGVTIDSVEGDEELTLAYPWPGIEFTDEEYVIRQESPTRHTPSELAGRTNDLLTLLNIYKRSVAIFTVEEFGVNTPPEDYAVDDMLVVGTAPTGAFSDHSNQIAQKTTNGWTFFTNENGWITIAKDSTPNVARNWNATEQEWQTTGSLLGAPINRGPWNALTTYRAGELVSYGNVIWSADQENTGSPPGGSPSDWSEWLKMGEHGGSLTLTYTFRTSTSAAAAAVAGQVNLNAAPAGASIMRINPVDAFGNDWVATLASLGDGTSTRKGRVRLIVPGDPTRQWTAAVLSVTAAGSPLDYYELTLEDAELGGNAFADEALVLFMWSDVGDAGAAGGQGSTGRRGLGSPIAVPYIFSTEIDDADPTPGKVRLGSATQNLATALRADALNSALADVTAILDAIPVIGVGAIIAIGSLDHASTPETKFLKFKVTAFASPTGYRNLTIEMLASSGANPFAADDEVVLNLTPLLKGDDGEQGLQGEQGPAFRPDYTVASIDLRALYDLEPVGTTVLVENDSTHGNVAMVYTIVTAAAGSPIEGTVWSGGVPFAPEARADALSFDDTEPGLSEETTLTANTVQDAIEAAAIIAGYMNAPEVSIAAAATTDIFSGTSPDGIASGNEIKWAVTGTAGPITSLGNGPNRFKIVRWAAASSIVNSAALILIDGHSRTNLVDSYSFFMAGIDGIPREIYYSAYDFSTAVETNFIDNPSFDVAQRGTSFALSATVKTQILDRWKAYAPEAGWTVSQQAGFSGAKKCVRVQRNAGSTSGLSARLWHQLLAPIPEALQGKTVRLSFDIRCGADYSGGGVALRFHTGTGEDEAVDLASGAAGAFPTGGALLFDNNVVVPTTTPQRVTVDAIVLGTTIKEMAFSLRYGSSGTAGAADYIEITNVKLQVGAFATEFVPEPTAQIWAKCLRACYSGANKANGVTSGTFRIIFGTFPVPMRVAPSVTLLDTSPDGFRGGGAAADSGSLSAIFQGSVTTKEWNIVLSGFTSITAGTHFYMNNATDVLLFDADIL